MVVVYVCMGGLEWVIGGIIWIGTSTGIKFEIPLLLVINKVLTLIIILISHT